VLLESANQVGRREPGRLADVFQPQCVGAVIGDVVGGALQLA